MLTARRAGSTASSCSPAGAGLSAARACLARRLREEMFGRADEDLGGVLAAAVARGELRPGAEEHLQALVSHILGPLLFQRFMLGTRLDENMVADAVDTALAPWQPDA
ncbi:TetR-like C-terminal domain-containing protein [Streptomyces sp. S.PB5]|uniref:TetR-like C-terminal domain-containing protein n=1 Tax=Streptomyces sp. S.PB5 TaxID=3020844 RepID=UPI0025AF9205|nr:TetR-like C-terminal domain-containing protein [Streptomyces sp. S.PB5]MDN3029724.1 TetR-like C-terminal domain-containing protein [Streptomyces sp. S.PB5]